MAREDVIQTLKQLTKEKIEVLLETSCGKDFFYDHDCDTPDMDRIAEALEERGEDLKELCETPECKEYLKNTTCWIEINDEKNKLLKQLNSVKRQEIELLNKCRAYEDLIAPEKPISQSKARINSLINKK